MLQASLRLMALRAHIHPLYPPSPLSFPLACLLARVSSNTKSCAPGRGGSFNFRKADTCRMDPRSVHC